MVDFSEYRNKAGIYKWENKINHKCYIGQAKDLNRRLIHHFSNIKTGRYNSPLYKAVAKYGINNFDITIVEVLEASDDLNKRLDEREIYYIEYYKSYKEGYNQTKGGDGGITGYKFTEEQRNKVSENSKRQAASSYKSVFLYDTVNRSTLIVKSISAAAELLSTTHSQISRICSWDQLLLNGRFIGAHNKQQLKQRIIYFYVNKNVVRTEKDCAFRKKPALGLKRHFNTLSGRKEITVEWRNKIKNSLYRYAVEVYENGKLFAYYDNTEHANEFFGYSDSSTVLKTIKRSIRLNSIYKKKYTFKLIEKHNGIED